MNPAPKEINTSFYILEKCFDSSISMHSPDEKDHNRNSLENNKTSQGTSVKWVNFKGPYIGL